jgi:hypothetical protein
MRKLYRRPWFIVLVAVFLSAAAAGGWLYHTLFGNSDRVGQELVDQFGQDFFTDFDLERFLPAIEDDLDETKTGGPEQPVNPPASGEPAAPQPPAAPPPPPPPALTAAMIMARFEPRFRGLEQLAEEKLGVLFAAGKAEYIQQSNDGTLNRFELMNKYILAGRTLEKNIDAVFYGLLDELKLELQKNSFPTEVAKTIESDYKKLKEARRRSFLSLL